MRQASQGAVDYFRTVPPNSSGKRRATRHALANVSATLLFGVAWLMRRPILYQVLSPPAPEVEEVAHPSPSPARQGVGQEA